MEKNEINIVEKDSENVKINEGEENDELWIYMGGEGEYKKGYDGKGIKMIVKRLLN
jgi:hypothetical protein